MNEISPIPSENPSSNDLKMKIDDGTDEKIRQMQKRAEANAEIAENRQKARERRLKLEKSQKTLGIEGSFQEGPFHASRKRFDGMTSEQIVEQIRRDLKSSSKD